VRWFWAFFTSWHFQHNVATYNLFIPYRIGISFYETEKLYWFCFQITVTSMSCIFGFFLGLEMVNVMFIARLASHLQSIVSLLNWNCIHLSFLLQLWGKAPWTLSQIQCWPRVSTRAMSSSPLPILCTTFCSRSIWTP